MSEHSPIGASSAKRWMACPASIRLSQGIEQKESKYAAEGTAAHELAEMCLLKEVDAADYKGKVINGFTVDTEMVEAVQYYLDYIRELEDTAVVCEKMVEEKFNLDFIHEGMFGTNDCCLVIDCDELHIIDLKYGKGVAVNAWENPQLMYYALGAMQCMLEKNEGKQTIERIQMHIVQPRMTNEDKRQSTYDMTADELIEWGKEVLQPAAVATEDPDAPARTGDHCRWCPALPTCPAQKEDALAVAKADFNTLALPDPKTLPIAELVKIKAMAERMAAWSRSCAEYLHDRAEQGEVIPDHKLVAKRSNRKWVNDSEAEQFLVDTLGRDAYNHKLLSPAQAEKKMNKEGKKALQGFIHQPDAGLTLVPSTDKRKEVKPQTKRNMEALLDFTEDLDDDIFS